MTTPALDTGWSAVTEYTGLSENGGQMNQEVLDKIKPTMIEKEDFEAAGIYLDALDPETQTEVLKVWTRNLVAVHKELVKQYKAVRENMPDLYIAALEGPDLPDTGDQI
ncbi:hypothetical protein FACS189483_09090 [Spirochaetia bacterium]|nr:hypothetical protein FACS189483_09090 [Spirochaetia bacterium]